MGICMKDQSLKAVQSLIYSRIDDTANDLDLWLQRTKCMDMQAATASAKFMMLMRPREGGLGAYSGHICGSNVQQIDKKYDAILRHCSWRS